MQTTQNSHQTLKLIANKQPKKPKKMLFFCCTYCIRFHILSQLSGAPLDIKQCRIQDLNMQVSSGNAWNIIHAEDYLGRQAELERKRLTQRFAKRVQEGLTNALPLWSKTNVATGQTRTATAQSLSSRAAWRLPRP